MICVTAPVAAPVLAKSGARRAPARSVPRQARVSPRVSPIASRGVTLRVSASEDDFSSSSASVETKASPASAPSPANAPMRARITGTSSKRASFFRLLRQMPSLSRSQKIPPTKDMA